MTFIEDNEWETEMYADKNFYFDSDAEFDAFMRNNDYKDSFNYLTLNVARVSSLSKFEELVIYILSLVVQPVLIVLTETWIVKGTEGLYRLPGYSGYHCCRETSSAGVAVFIKTGFKLDVIEDDAGPLSYIQFKFYPENSPSEFVIGTACYLPKRSDYYLVEDQLCNILDKWKNSRHILLGDFNINVKEDSAVSRSYINMLESLGYRVTNTLVTRPASGTVIDHSILNFHEAVNATVKSGLSDHNSLFGFLCDLFKQKVPVKRYERRNIKSTNFDQAAQELSYNLTSNDLDVMGPNEALLHIVNQIKNAIDNNTVERTIRIRTGNDWVTPEIVRLSRKKHGLLRKKEIEGLTEYSTKK